jgi:rhodanese-related sulfurtransferase
MASSYTTNSGIEKPAQGDQTGEWGTTINTNMDIIDRSINGVLALSLSGTTTTLTTTDGTLTDGMYKVLVLGGSPSGTNTITVAPNDADKLYFVVNSSGQTATFTQGSGANVNVLNGDTAVIYCDGAGSGAAVADFTKDLGMSSVNIDGGTIDGAIIGGASAAAGTFTTLDTSGAVNLNLTTDSSSSTSGALIVDGGVGIAKKLYVGTDADIDGTLEADAMTLNGSAITTTATLSTGISNTNVPVFTSGVADDDFLRVAGTSIEGRSASEVLSDIGGQASLTFGISNTNAVKIDSASVADDEYASFTANGLESRSTAEVLSDIGGSAAAGSSSIVTTGALDAGSITRCDNVGFGAIDNGTSNIRSATITAETAFVPDTSGGADLGTTSLEFNDLFLNDAGSIQLGDDQDVTITHVADTGITLNDKDIAGVSSINSGQIGGRRNVIHNPNGAVNQRHGTAANADMNTYAMDRWRSFGGGTGYGQSFLSGSDAGEGDGYYIRYQRPNGNSTTFATGIAQGLETVDSKHLAGKTVTLSFRARGGANWSPTSGSATFRVVGGEGTDESPVGMTTAENAFTVTADIPQGGGFVTYSGTGTIPADKTQIAIQIAWTWTGTAGANDYIDVRNLQLEIGSTATTFEQLSYGEELHRCQRYCFVARPPTNTALATGFARTTTTVHCVKAFPVTMRTTPSLAFSSATDFQVQYLGSVATTTAMAASELGPDTMAFQASVGSGLTAGQGMYVRDLNGGATITAAAEL